MLGSNQKRRLGFYQRAEWRGSSFLSTLFLFIPFGEIKAINPLWSKIIFRA